MMKKITLLFTLLLTTLATQAQTFYELQFTHPLDGKKYLGLMTYFSDERCKMRIVRADEGSKGKVWESDYEKEGEPVTTENTFGVMYYRPLNGRSMPTVFWHWHDFRAEDMKPEPKIFYDLTDPSNYFDATSFKEKQLSELTAAYLEKFYKPTDAEYKNLLAAAKKVGAQNKTEVVSRGTDTPTLLAKAIENFKPGKQDIVVFVYSGHGFRFQDQKDYFPCIDLSPTAYDKAVENYTTMTEIYKAITDKGARLNIVLSDCCNTKVGQETPTAVSISTLFSRASHSLDTDKLRTLFLGQGGNVWATAASPGEASWCSVKGGFFLLSFIESLRYQISTLTQEKPSWESLINLAIDEARKKTNGNGVPREQNGLKQVRTKSIQ